MSELHELNSFSHSVSRARKRYLTKKRPFGRRKFVPGIGGKTPSLNWFQRIMSFWKSMRESGSKASLDNMREAARNRRKKADSKRRLDAHRNFHGRNR